MAFKEKREKLFVLDTAQTSLLFNITLASAKIKELLIEQPEGMMNLRPPLHLIMYGRIGSGKSTILRHVREKLNLTSYSLTKAGLIGTVERHTGKIIAPAVWECRNSLLLLDEFDFNAHSNSDKGLMQELLKILEDAVYTRKIGFKAVDDDFTDEDLYLKIKKGNVEVKTRFGMIMNTMMNLQYTQSPQLLALISRCIVIPHYPTQEQLKRIARGENLYLYEDFHQKFHVKDKVLINKADYLIMVEFIEKRFFDFTAYLRCIGDLCRVFAVLGTHNFELYELICVLKTQLSQETLLAEKITRDTEKVLKQKKSADERDEQMIKRLEVKLSK